MTSDLRSLLGTMVQRGASDLHLTVGQPPMLRIDGELRPCEGEAVLAAEDTGRLARSALSDEQHRRFEEDAELDLAMEVAGLARFRLNLYRQRGSVGLAVRLIPLAIPLLEELGLPPVLRSLAERPRGLVLVTGATGSGKSTTLAAMIDRINRERRGHILTIEDPIEFVHAHRGCIVNQREVGSDTGSFGAALRHALRQDPDVILVGELRDLETIQAALTIAETGHLCLATLHTNSAPESIDRVIDVFPAHQQPQVRAQLAAVLEGVVTQTLVPRTPGPGRVAACEVLVATPAVRACIRDDKVHQIPSLMQAGRTHGMQTLNDALRALHRSGDVSLEACLKRSPDPADLQRGLGPAAR
jgi:twitching motility protein PilT